MPKIPKSAAQKHRVKQKKQLSSETDNYPFCDETYRILFNTIAYGVVFWNAESRIINANPAAERILGMKLSELWGKNSAQVFADPVREDGMAISQQEFPADIALRTGKPVEKFIMGAKNSGECDMRWLNVSAVPIIHHSESKYPLVYTLLEDITEQRRISKEMQQTREQLEQEVQERSRELQETKEALDSQISMCRQVESELRESEDKFRRIAENADDLLYLYRLQPERRFEYVSSSATDITGYTPEEHYANPALGLQIVHAEDKAKLFDLFAGRSDFRAPLILRLVRKDGRIIWTEQRNVPVKDKNGKIIAVQGIVRDISDRMQIEERLRASEKFLQTVIDSEPECVKLLARDGTVLNMNPAGLKMLDAESLDQVQGKIIYDMVLPSYRRDFAALTNSVFEGNKGTLVFEAEGLKGRRIWLETSTVPLRDENNEIIAALSITRDITDRRRAEQLLSRVAERISEKTGEAYFRAVTEFIVQELGTDYAFIGEKLPDGRKMRTIGLYAKGNFAENFEYDVSNTPCENLIGKTACFYAQGMQAVFPKDSLLATMKIESYAGIPLFDSSEKPLGGLVTMGCSPMQDKDKDRILSLLKIFAGRVAAELERMQAETALRSSEQRYRQLLESVTSYMYTVTVENKKAVSTVHGAGCSAVTGYTSEEYSADPYLWYRMVFDEDKPLVLDQAARVLSGIRPQPIEHRVRHKNGQIVWIRNSVVPRVDEKGVVTAYDGIIEDITERKKAEQFIKNILETVDEGFIVIDRDFNVVTANKAYCRLTGLKLSDILGRKCYEVSHKIMRPCYEQGEECAVRSAFESAEPRTVLHTHHDASGMPIFVETKAFPLKDEFGEITAAIEIVNNITDRKRLEDQLRHAQKMEAVGLLAGGIAHDFNNILTAIVGYGNLLKIKTAPEASNQIYIDQILASAARAANLTHGLLAFSRKQPINPRPIDLNAVIRNVEKFLLRLIGEDIELSTALSEGSLTVLADSSQVEQVLMNIATNARDAMPQGGILTISTSTAVINHEFRKIHGFGVPGVYACVKITDTGIGMDEATRIRVFEPFFTTKDAGKGTGLGLAIVYGIMKQNKGYIVVDSLPGKGSTFSLYFPIISASVEDRHTEEAEETIEGTETILVAEDDAEIRRLTGMMLAEFGYRVIEAEDGMDAVNKFQEHKNEVQLVLLDMVMPRMSGKEARNEILKIRPGVKTLFISGYSTDMLEAKGITEAADHISKPISPADLLRIVRRALDK